MSDAIPLRPGKDGTITVNGNEVFIDSFVTRDPDVVDAISDADDMHAATHACLTIGARALKVTSASVDANLIENAVGTITTGLDETVQSALRAVEQTTAQFFAEDGTVNEAMQAFKRQLDEQLGSAFDPNSKKSIVASFETVITESAERQRRAMAGLLDPTDEASPLHRMRREMTTSMRDHQESLSKLINELSERIAVQAKGEEMIDLTTLKGLSFEDLVHDMLCPLAALYGDTAEQTGRAKGLAGSGKGDETVTLNPDDTGPVPGIIALEMKDTRLSWPQVTAELDAAAENRAAQAAVLVFASQEQAPTSVPFHFSNDRAIVVLDKADPDPYVLRLAYLWGRWVVRRSLQTVESDELDRERVRGLIERGTAALKKARTIKGAHTAAKKEIERAQAHVEDLTAEVQSSLDQLAVEIDG